MVTYINRALDHVRCDRTGSLVTRGMPFDASGDREAYLLRAYGSGIEPVTPKPAAKAEAPAPKPIPKAEAPNAEVEVDVASLHVAKINRIARGLGYDGEPTKAGALTFLAGQSSEAVAAAVAEALA